MNTTKSEILAHLKRTGGSSIEELATSLGLARMTVRQHLATLERDGLVLSREERRPAGRPRFVFSLSDRGEETFPKRYDRLAGLLIQEASLLESEELIGLTPADKKKLLFEKIVERLFAQHEARVKDKNLQERVAAVTEILEDEGGFAEWTSASGGFEITDYNCVYRRVADSDDALCDWHLALLTRLMGSDVRCTQFMSKGAECCRFVVESDGVAQAGTAKPKERKAG